MTVAEQSQTRIGRIPLAWIEVAATILLATATVATAWSGYQASRWNGEQARDSASANAARISAARSAGLANAQKQVDVAVFIQWVDAYAQQETELEEFYFARFREEFRPAIEAWLATKPLENPNAPLTPFAMPEYVLAAEQEAAEFDATAETKVSEARDDIQRSTNYVLSVVLFASALFFAAMSTKVTLRPLQLAVLVVGCLIFLGTLTWVATFPVNVSV